MANSENVVNQLLGAIDTVIGKRLEQLSYDKTIICTIIDDSKAKNGEYQVTDGSVKFWAKCENANYRNDEQVRVSVPNGDTTQEKFIIGKYVKDSSNTPITYMTPLSSVLKMSGDICNTQDSDVFGLQATGPVNGAPTKTGVLLWTADITEETAAMANSQIYDVIYIQADFKTTLSNYNITSGTYGLMLSLGTTLANGEPGPAVTCLFDSNQMLGNPYSFGIYTPQAAKFDITNVGKLSSVQLLFYQDGNFTHNTTTIDSVPLTYPDEISNMNNILIKNIKIGFGADVTNVADETVRLFTTDDLRYDNDSTTNAITNEKHLKFAWYNKDENGQYIGFNDGLDASGNVKWINEDSYLEVAGHNAKLQAQQNYDIPMDEIGLSLAAETKTIRDTLLGVSKSLSTDLHALMSTLINRCDITSIQSYLENIDDYVCKQALSLNGKTNLTEVANDCYDWYMNALNQAAAKHNKGILPTQVSGSWTFKGDGTNPGTEPGYHKGFSDFFEALYKVFYPSATFLPELHALVTGSYTGYKGIYDDSQRKITALLSDLSSKWNKALEDLENNAGQIAAYFQPNYSFNAWVEIDTSAYDNGYAIYWYRYNPNASGDNFMSRGWERVTPLPTDTRDGIVISCDAVNMEKEEFKVLILYNHEKYESNTLTFTNQSPVLNGATALLSDHITINHDTNSQESYQSYSIANTLINGADRYTKRELNVSFAHSDGTVDNKALVNAQVYWYIPENATMLDYDLTDLLSLNTANNFTNDITSIGHSEMYREGYACFYKTIGHGLTSETIEDYIKDLKFCYRIKNYYTPTAAQNTIYCTVINNDIKYHTEILMTFSSYGTSGTDYTLTVSPATKQAAVTPQNIGDNAWRLNIALYDNTNTPVSGFGVNLKQKVSNSRYKVTGPFSDEEGYYCLVSFKEEGDLCDILEVSVPGMQHGESTVNLTTFFPIPYSINTDYYVEGASTVVYDSQGGNPSYFKQPYKIFQQIPPSGEGESGEVSGLTWDVLYTANPPAEVKAYLPTLSKGALLPAAMWVDGGDISYDAKKNATSHCAYVQCSNGSDVVWSQPILVIQNRYPSPMLNAWDGKFTIDEENGTILSTMVSAGRKNKDNQFEGVLMGDIEAGAKFNPDNKSGLGIYGFHAGAQAFGFNIDGTAFLGKSGRGRILFDGNSGSISSASYQQTRTGNTDKPSTAGMMIDLDDGFIDMLGTKKNDNGLYETDGTQSQVHLDVKSPYFYIKSQTGVELIHIGDKGDEERTPDYYLQTNDFKLSELWSGNSYQVGKDPGAGMKLNLAQGKIQAYNFELRGEDSRKDAKTLGSYVYLSSDPADMVRVRYRNNDFDTNGIDVLAIGTNNYILKSFNWWDEDSDRVHDNITPKPLTGMLINLQDGIFEAYAENGPNATNWFRIDASYDSIVPLAIGDRSNPSFKIAWDGALKINNNAFNVDADGNFWVNGADLGNAIFSVTNQGEVSMKSGSITLGTITKDDGTEATSFYVDQDGNLSIGGTAFTINARGEMTATSGTIGGWEITPKSLAKGVLTLNGDDGTITAKVEENTTFKVDGTTGLLQAVNATLTTLTVVDKLQVQSPPGTTNQADLKVYGNTTIYGNTSISGNTAISGSIDLSGDILMPYGDLCTAPKDASGNTTGAFISFGNGGGNIWVYGNFYIAANSGASAGQTGKLIVQDTARFNKPDCVLFGYESNAETLPQYINRTVGLVTEGEITSIGFAFKAHQLTDTSKTPYGLGGETQPVYFSGGVPKTCKTYAEALSGYATQTWVNNKKYVTETTLNNKGYLTSIPDDVVRDSDIADFVTSSTTSLTNYVLTSTYESKIEELEGIIETLQNEIETLKNNSSGGDSSTEES